MKFQRYDKIYKDQVFNIFKKYWTDKVFLKELEKAIDLKPYNFYITLNVDNEVVGIVGLKETSYFLKEKTVNHNNIELYIIASKNKDAGVGTFMCSEIIKVCKESGYLEIICYSPDTHKSSWRFYERNQFQNLGIVYDPDDGYSGIAWSRLVK